MCAHQETGDIGKKGFLAGTWKSRNGRVSGTGEISILPLPKACALFSGGALVCLVFIVVVLCHAFWYDGYLHSLRNGLVLISSGRNWGTYIDLMHSRIVRLRERFLMGFLLFVAVLVTWFCAHASVGIVVQLAIHLT